MQVRVSSCTTGSLSQQFCEENFNAAIQNAHILLDLLWRLCILIILIRSRLNIQNLCYLLFYLFFYSGAGQ